MLHRDWWVHGFVAAFGIVAAVVGFASGYGACLLFAGVVLSSLAANFIFWQWSVFPYDRILSASSEDGLSWDRDEGVRLDVGGLNGSSQVYYPDLFSTTEGLRMYYRGGGDDSVILSAFSTDGLCWREEPGERVGLRGGFKRLGSSDIVALPEGYRIYFAADDGERWKIYRAESPDGLNWGAETCCIDTGPHDLPHVQDPSIVTFEGCYQMYFMRFSARETHIYTSISSDGLQWSEMQCCQGLSDAQTAFVRTPNVVPLDDGNWRMYFAETTGASALGSRIASAVSSDGLQWRRDEGIRLHPGGELDGQGVFCPEVVRIGDRWKMYYGGYWNKHWLAPYTLFRHRPR